MKILKSLQALKEEDHRRALYVSLVFIMLMILFFLLVSLEEPDPPLKEPIVEIELPDVEILETGSADEGGSNSDEGNPETEVNNVQETVQHHEVQEESHVTVSSGNGENTNQSQDNNQNQPDNTFSFPGNGGGNGNGNGTGFGDGDGVGNGGNGTGPGSGTYNPNRKVLKDPDFDGHANEEGKIALDIWVDADGNVVKTRLKASKSTSGSAYLISLAEKAAKTMKYDRKPDAGWEHVGYKVFSFIKI